LSAVQDVLSIIRLSAVYEALTGVTPRRTGTDRWRAPAKWRGGNGLTVSMDDSRGCWHDFKTDDHGGILDLVVQVRGGTRQEALRWCAAMAGVALEGKPLSPGDRARWARERRALERDLPTARYWRRSALLLCDERLVLLKAALFDPIAPTPAFGEIADWTREHARLSRIDGAALVEVYREAMRREPHVTAAMVRWARDRERSEIRALLRYLEFEAETP
jgi:hypothetical protein